MAVVTGRGDTGVADRSNPSASGDHKDMMRFTHSMQHRRLSQTVALAGTLLSAALIVPADAPRALDDTYLGLAARTGWYPYLDTSWPTLHGDPGNSDSARFDPPSPLMGGIHLLDGLAAVTAATVDDDLGAAYFSSGSPDQPHLHALSIDAVSGAAVGAVLWTSDDWNDEVALGAAAMASAPVIDADGNLYIGDEDYLWSATDSGTLRWRADLPTGGSDAPSPFVTAFFTPGGLVGGVTSAGVLGLYDRADGNRLVELALPGLIPDAEPATRPGPIQRLIERCLWRNPDESYMVEPDDMAKLALAAYTGACAPVSNTPALLPHPDDPAKAWIFVPGILEATDGEGNHHVRLFRIEVAQDESTGAVTAAISPDFDGLMPGGRACATSPTLDLTGTAVFVADNRGTLYAFDATSGEALWTLDIGILYGSFSAPRTGAHVIYAASADTLTCVDIETRDIAWQYEYHALARRRLPFRFGFERVTLLAGIPIASANHILLPMTIGYRLPVVNNPIFVWPLESLLVVLDREGGLVGEPVVLNDTTETYAAPTANGSVVVTHAAVLSSLSHCMWRNNIWGLGALLPEPVRPVAGVTLFASP